MARDYKLVNSSPVESFRENVEIAKTSSSFVRPQRTREGQKISAIISNWSRIADNRWQLPLWFPLFTCHKNLAIIEIRLFVIVSWEEFCQTNCERNCWRSQIARNYCRSFEATERSLHPRRKLKVKEKTTPRSCKRWGYKHPFIQPPRCPAVAASVRKKDILRRRAKN